MDITELSKKLDKILEQQDLILSKLENKIVLDSNLPRLNSKVSSKQKERQEMEKHLKNEIEEMIVLRPHKRRLQQQFNLLVPPQNNRVKDYLRTKDPKAFDGLKRNV